MKKRICYITLLLLTINGIFASGNADQKSEALLFKQKRTKWNDAPDSAIFYECYMLNIKESDGNDKTILLDSFKKDGFMFLKDGIMLINPSTSMSIAAHNAPEMLKQEKVVYKCVVLYSTAVLGTAVVNIFKAEPVKQQIGYIIGYELSDFLDDNDMNCVETVIGYQDENVIYAYFPQSKRSFLQLDQWPEPTKFNLIDGLTMMKSKYDKDILYLDDLVKKRDGYSSQEIAEEKAELKKNYDAVYSILSKYSLLKL